MFQRLLYVYVGVGVGSGGLGIVNRMEVEYRWFPSWPCRPRCKLPAIIYRATSAAMNSYLCSKEQVEPCVYLCVRSNVTPHRTYYIQLLFQPLPRYVFLLLLRCLRCSTDLISTRTITYHNCYFGGSAICFRFVVICVFEAIGVDLMSKQRFCFS